MSSARLVKLSVIFSLAVFIVGCLSLDTRIIEQTDTTAIIQGTGATKIDAKINAEKRAREIFPEYVETKECECTQEYQSRVSGEQGKVQGGGKTYYSCILTIKKK